MPYYKLAYEYLAIQPSNYYIFIPTLPHLKNYIDEYVSNWNIETIVTSNLTEINKHYNYTTHALVCSGTASLEIAKRNIPQIVIYKLNYLTEIICKLFIKIRFANILNIVENKIIIPEIINSNLNKDSFLKEFIKLINSENDNQTQIENVKKTLINFDVGSPPYEVAANRINYYLN